MYSAHTFQGDAATLPTCSIYETSVAETKSTVIIYDVAKSRDEISRNTDTVLV